MHKKDIVAALAEELDLSKSKAEKAVNLVLEKIKKALVDGDSVTLMGFGSFNVVQRAQREGRNPATGEKMTIPASKTVKFKPSKVLKEAVQ